MSGLLSNYLRTKRFSAARPYISGDVLDLGCGFAEVLGWLEPDQGYVGVEGHPKIYAWLKDQFPGREFHQCNFDTDTLQLNRRFDTILMLAVIEHLEHPQNILRQIPSYLTTNGKFVLTTPSPFGDRIHKIGTVFGLFSKYAVEEHKNIFNYESLHKIIEECGLRIDQYRKLLFGGNQLLICSKSNE